MRRILLPAVFFLVVVCLFWLWPKQGLLDDGALLVVLDPGHGGSAPGAFYDDTYEKDLNLAVALRVRDILAQQEDITVLMTREGDEAIGLYERAALANDNGADLFVSIHSNALENNNDFEGIYTFYGPDRTDSAPVAQAIQTALAASTGGVDRGIRSEDFVVVRETKMPSVLVEMGFMTSQNELKNLKDSDYQTKIAQGIVTGILGQRTAPAN